jgi:hypothetical protein
MTRACALLMAIAALLVACGKYGPPKRVRPEPTASPAVELETGADSPEEPDEDQEKDQ